MSEKKDTTILTDAILPKARASDIVVQKIENEILVYDLLTKKAHHLNETMGFVWKRCDGHSSVNDIATALGQKTRSEIGVDLVLLTLSELEKANLLEKSAVENQFEKVSRRNVLFKYTTLAIALPAVVSLIAPQAVSAQSCPPRLSGPGGMCFENFDCCPGLVCIAIGLAAGTCQPPIVPPPP